MIKTFIFNNFFDKHWPLTVILIHILTGVKYLVNVEALGTTIQQKKDSVHNSLILQILQFGNWILQFVLII